MRETVRVKTVEEITTDNELSYISIKEDKEIDNNTLPSKSTNDS